MAPPFLRRVNSPTCFFCLSAVSPAPVDARSFRCAQCGCWNRYDANGEITSDEPAMHDEKLNATSFAKRASPNKDRLPSTYAKPPFCHTCQTNQMLLVNLLSNYLPPSQHPDYPQRLEQLPAYRDSLHARYPPVCTNCLPAVQDEIEQKNQMARTKALGGWLKESKGKERHRFGPGSENDRERLGFQLAVWRIRGALWWTTLLAVIAAHAAAIRGYEFPRPFTSGIPALPIFCLLSLFYTAWDPTYYRFKKARVQGRDVRIKGKTHYVALQLLSWLSRLITSILLVLAWRSSSRDYLHISAYPLSYRVSIYCSISLIVEMLVFSSSFAILHLQKPPTIRLIETTSVRNTPESPTHSARASPMPPASVHNDPDLFASLSLSSKPLIPPAANPIFGHPSLVSSTSGATASQTSPMKIDDGPDEDAMDWTPTNPSPAKVRSTADDGAWLRPQRFFPPEHPTGLESLFANTKLDDADAHAAKPTTPTGNGLRNTKAIGWLAVTITMILIPLGSIVYHMSGYND